MKKLLLALVGISIGTMLFFNFSSGIIGGLWLLLTGGGGIVVSGLILSFIMPFVYSIAFLPQLLLIPLLTKTTEKGYRIISSILIFITVFYGYFLLALWVSYVFGWILPYKNLHPLALWLWAYSVVMSPISYLASKEGSDAGIATSLGLIFTQISFFILSAGLLFGNLNAGYTWVWLFLVIFSIVSASLGFLAIPKKEKVIDISTSAIQQAEIIPEHEARHHAKFHLMTHCSNCNNKIDNHTKFCKYCGFKLLLG